MSFSGKVKEELARNISSARHCQIAELTAFIGMCGTVVINSFDRCSIKIRTENILVARKVFTLIEKTFNIKSQQRLDNHIIFMIAYKQILGSSSHQGYDVVLFVITPAGWIYIRG